MIRNLRMTAVAVGLTAAFGAAPASAYDPVVEAQARLGLELAAALVSEGGAKGRNQVVSPFILSSTLSLLYLGAEHDVKTVLDKSLGFGGEGYATFRDLSKAFDADPEVAVATNLWFDTESRPIQAGLIALKHEFDLEPQTLDFGEGKAVDEINGWIERETAGAIRNVVDRLSKQTDFVAASAIHFKGSWRYSFDAAETKPAPFHAASGEAQQIPFMTRSGEHILYREDQGWRAVELQYEDDRYRMVALLPPEDEKALPRVLAKKGEADVAHILGMLRGEKFMPATGRFFLPKLTLTSACDCLPLLKRTFGMVDKRGRLLKSAPARRLVFPGLTTSELSEVRLASMFTLDEQGTEAAAASVATGTRGFSVGPEPFELRFDRPFVIALRERESGMILFLALVQDLGDQKTAASE